MSFGYFPGCHIAPELFLPHHGPGHLRIPVSEDPAHLLHPGRMLCSDIPGLSHVLAQVVESHPFRLGVISEAPFLVAHHEGSRRRFLIPDPVHSPASRMLADPDQVIADLPMTSAELRQQAAAVNAIRLPDTRILHEGREYVHRADQGIRNLPGTHSRGINEHRNANTALPGLPLKTSQRTVLGQNIDFGPRSAVVANEGNHRM